MRLARNFRTTIPLVKKYLHNALLFNNTHPACVYEGGVKVAIHRIREVIKNEISQTVKVQTDIDAEMHDLLTSVD